MSIATQHCMDNGLLNVVVVKIDALIYPYNMINELLQFFAKNV